MDRLVPRGGALDDAAAHLLAGHGRELDGCLDAVAHQNDHLTCSQSKHVRDLVRAISAQYRLVRDVLVDEEAVAHRARMSRIQSARSSRAVTRIPFAANAATTSASACAVMPAATSTPCSSSRSRRSAAIRTRMGPMMFATTTSNVSPTSAADPRRTV